MRTYPQDSAQAAARIVAMAALADGHLCSTEVERLDHAAISKALGLESGEWHRVLRDYCEDVLLNSPLGWSSLSSNTGMIGALLDEFRDPALRRTVMDLCAAVADADSRQAEGEAIVLETAAAHWGLQTRPRALTWC